MVAKSRRLAVVTAIANPERYWSRYRLYQEFAARVRAAGVDLFTVECAFGDRPWAVTQEGNPHHLQLRSSQQVWLKENLLNLGVQMVPADYRYIALVDADFAFARPNWAQETVEQLQHHPTVQMFSTVHYLDANHDVINSRVSFAERWRRGLPFKAGHTEVCREGWPYAEAKPAVGAQPKAEQEKGGDSWGPPGGAWAFRRKVLEQVGMLVDFCILGSADWWMVLAMLGVLKHALPHSYSAGYRGALHAWEEQAARVIQGDIGVVPGAALHYWHGSMADRGYQSRESILKRHAFDPATDLVRDDQGVIGLAEDGSERLRLMKSDLRRYFCSRNEDAR